MKYTVVNGVYFATAVNACPPAVVAVALVAPQPCLCTTGPL
jgi:hypothetical protein